MKAGSVATACAAALFLGFVTTACGSGPSAAGGAKSAAAAVSCATGAVGSTTSANVNTPAEPDSGVNTIAGKCWASIAPTPITEAVIRAAPSGTSADFKTAWSAKAFYTLVEVHTGRALINTNTSAVWQDDTAEIYLGPNDRAGTYQTGDGQMDINSGGLTSTNFGPDHSQVPSAGLAETVKTSATGYTGLLIVPWSNIAISAPKKGVQVGFTVGVNWPNADASKRIGQTMFVGTDANSSDDSNWGTATLS